MKQISTILYLIYHVILFVIAGVLLASIVIIIATKAWHYLFVCFPVLLYIYKSEAIHFRKNKHKRTGKKS
jgi:hypothetical protein